MFPKGYFARRTQSEILEAQALAARTNRLTVIFTGNSTQVVQPELEGATQPGSASGSELPQVDGNDNGNGDVGLQQVNSANETSVIKNANNCGQDVSGPSATLVIHQAESTTAVDAHVATVGGDTMQTQSFRQRREKKRKRTRRTRVETDAGTSTPPDIFDGHVGVYLGDSSAPSSSSGSSSREENEGPLSNPGTPPQVDTTTINGATSPLNFPQRPWASRTAHERAIRARLGLSQLGNTHWNAALQGIGRPTAKRDNNGKKTKE